MEGREEVDALGPKRMRRGSCMVMEEDTTLPAGPARVAVGDDPDISVTLTRAGNPMTAEMSGVADARTGSPTVTVTFADTVITMFVTDTLT